MALENVLGGLALDATLIDIRDGVAKEVTLGDIRDTVAKEATLGTRSSEATLQAVRDSILRRTDPLAAGLNNIGYTSPGTAQKVGQGRFFISTVGRITLTVAGNLRATLTNPAGSTKNIQVVRITAFGTQVGFASLLLNPTTGVPGTAPRPVLNAIAGGGVPPAGQLRADTSSTTPLGGGADTGIVIGIPPNGVRQIDAPPVIIAPGVTLGINVPFLGAADATMGIYWIEDPVA